MADLEQIPGNLNITFVGGDDITFTATITGDYSAYTHEAFVYDGHKLIATFAVTDIYTDPSTVISFVLTDTQTLAANPNALDWFYTQTYSGVTRTILSGSVTVVKR